MLLFELESSFRETSVRRMCTVRFNSVVRLALAILLVVSGNTPMLRHTHADGHAGHDHSTLNRKSSLAHRHGTHGHHHSHSGAADQSHSRLRHKVDHSVQHVHVGWFGFSCTLPCPVNSGSEPESNGPEVFLQNGPSDAALIAAQPLKPSFADLAVRPQADAQAVVTFTALARFTSTPVLAAPLSDAARHERSGVLLI